MEIEWINAAVNVVADNIKNKAEAPPFICFDAAREEVARCHSFCGEDCELLFEETGYPRVWLKVKGVLTLDASNPFAEPPHIVVPSSMGMYRTPAQPIRVDDDLYRWVEVKGPYNGLYDVTAEPFMWVECLKFEGITT